MRIIAGEHRGRRLAAPKGTDTRPTTDRVRESLMSALASARGGMQGAVVLDAFAGSGALGLEVMSRGGAAACLCERDSGALRVIESNVKALGYGRDEVRVCRVDVLSGRLPRLRDPYDLVMLDPPYALEPHEVFALLSRLDEARALSLDVVVSYEHDVTANAAVDAELDAGFLQMSSRRRYGDTVVDILVREKELQS